MLDKARAIPILVFQTRKNHLENGNEWYHNCTTINLNFFFLHSVTYRYAAIYPVPLHIRRGGMHVTNKRYINILHILVQGNSSRPWSHFVTTTIFLHPIGVCYYYLDLLCYSCMDEPQFSALENSSQYKRKSPIPGLLLNSSSCDRQHPPEKERQQSLPLYTYTLLPW